MTSGFLLEKNPTWVLDFQRVGPYAQTRLNKSILDRKKFYATLSVDELDVEGFVTTENLRLVKMITSNQSIDAPSFWGLQCERDHALREELALIHIEAVEAAAKADAEKMKKEQAHKAERVEFDELDALLEGRQPNIGAPEACISGQGHPDMSNPVAKMKKMIEDRATAAKASAKRLAKGPT
ncbi:uncharacterized protein LOC133805250 [Humulus lupulus]|uniref:uncharacterized protein LOC133805250 n=1 Tax=Humulus lupulus TaxID=3486 RepID=UPI002B40CE2A|nr:uncharacterized protein LOC133805250 [Humulus lupulus]